MNYKDFMEMNIINEGTQLLKYIKNGKKDPDPKRFEEKYQEYLKNTNLTNERKTRNFFLKDKVYNNVKWENISDKLKKYANKKDEEDKNSQTNNNPETNNDTEKKEENPKLAEIKEIKKMLSDGNADNNKEALERMLKLFKDAEPNEKVSKEKIEQDIKKIEDDLINKAETLDKKLEKGADDFQAAATSLKTESLKSFKQFVILKEEENDIKKVLEDLFKDLENLCLNNSDLDSNGSGNQLKKLFDKLKENPKLKEITEYIRTTEHRFAKTEGTFGYAILCMYASLGKTSTEGIVKILNLFKNNDFLKKDFSPANIKQISNEKKLSNDWLFDENDFKPEYKDCFEFLAAIKGTFETSDKTEKEIEKVNRNLTEYLTEFVKELKQGDINYIKSNNLEAYKKYEELLNKSKKEEKENPKSNSGFEEVERSIKKTREQYGFSTAIPRSFPRPSYVDMDNGKEPKEIEDYFEDIAKEFEGKLNLYSYANRYRTREKAKEKNPTKTWEESIRNASVLNKTITEGFFKNIANNFNNARKIKNDNKEITKSNLNPIKGLNDYDFDENGEINGIKRIEDLTKKFKEYAENIIKLHREKCNQLFKKSIGTGILSKKAIKGEKRLEYIDDIRTEMLNTKRELSELIEKFKKSSERGLFGKIADKFDRNSNLDWNQREYKVWKKKGERDIGLNDLISMLKSESKTHAEDIAKWIFAKMIIETSTPDIFEKLLNSKFSSAEIKEALKGSFHLEEIWDIDPKELEKPDNIEKTLGVLVKFTKKPKYYSTPIDLFNAKLPGFTSDYNLDSLKGLHTELHKNGEESELKEFSEKMAEFFTKQKEIVKVFKELKGSNIVSEAMFKRMKEKFLNEADLDSQTDPDDGPDVVPNPHDVEEDKQTDINSKINEYLNKNGKTSQSLNNLFGSGNKIDITGKGVEDIVFLQQMVSTNFCLIKRQNYYLLNINSLEELKALYKNIVSGKTQNNQNKQQPEQKDNTMAQPSNNQDNTATNNGETKVVQFNQKQLENGTLTTPTPEAIANKMADFGSSINTEKKKATVTTAACDSTYPVSAKQNKNSTTITYQNGPFKIVRRKFN